MNIHPYIHPSIHTSSSQYSAECTECFTSENKICHTATESSLRPLWTLKVLYPLHSHNFHKMHCCFKHNDFLTVRLSALLWFTDGLWRGPLTLGRDKEAEMGFKCFKMESHLFSLKGKLWMVNGYTGSGGSGSLLWLQTEQTDNVHTQIWNWWNLAIHSAVFKI